ncbi:hypothetical protein H6P81_008782 [Aristolochia fimbriata]|uniref:Uncharacterized protein n=1 Tax=Aristolochia fimbriata TaxID=158543 RepID=A0AAV7EM93_ARIFI|nr:hypothetical protein H6P81_008782 [Aristolochia fimbriata]
MSTFTHNMASRSSFDTSRLLTGSSKGSVYPVSVSSFPASRERRGRLVILPGKIVCSAESSTATATETKESSDSPKEAPAAKPTRVAPAKAPAKALPQMMEEDVIPSLKAILEAQDDLTEIELSFQDNKLEGSFVKNGIPYTFWAFFPNGVLTGPKGFSLTSYGSGASTVEPFLIDEKKITAKHVVFWVEKRLAAQGILPVWNE